ncbi:Amidophosphoribosyltransferase [Colletotrichum chlorophyti]|uniref:Amidophosphoribosyltransferase n=1 Tax=Colletotrichum chlorophyti TaxID=708187 RepID=A0A1Q8RA15_9PEZI|nr:Amidophosphoribosyltransferase [Colletotrichum chlorophyti]
MCGVSAILLGDTRDNTAAVELHESLYFLQHRGQDAAGIAVCEGGRVYQCKGNGMAAKVFDEGRRIANLPGWMGIAHLRYPTAGTSSAAEAQPLYVNAPFGLSIAVNGNLVNAGDLVTFLDREARRHVNTDSDSELLLNVFAHALNELGKARANVDDIFTALHEVDENGIRPLCIGSRPSATLEGGKDYFLASESIALRQLGFDNIVDILPGQAVFIPKGGDPQFRQIVEAKSYTPDVFEYVYFARPDSKIDGLSVHRSRQSMGLKLAKKMKATLGDQGIQNIDVVIPVPETSNTAAAMLAEYLNKPFSNAFVKNRYVYRTFILPGQKARKKGVRRKLSPITSEFKGKVVCLVDDSIVRGTTSREIVQMAREAGATGVLFVSCSPEVIHPHVYGIDLADPSELIAHGKTPEEVASLIGADSVIYQDLDDLKAACVEAVDDGKESVVTDFEVGVFCGKYKTAVPSGYFSHLHQLHEPKVKNATTTDGKAEASAFPVANGGPVNIAPGMQEDLSIHNYVKS